MEIKKEYMEKLKSQIIQDIENFPHKTDIESIILTGSLGRDEGTFHIDKETNNLILDSDVELALVYKPGKKDSAKTFKQFLIENYKEDMNPMTISLLRVRNMYNFNYSFKTPKYNSIFMYDLYNGSKTIWGTELLSARSLPYDKYEAKRIIANRIGEYACLKYIEKAPEKQIKQWEAKILLSVGIACCIIDNIYESPYKKHCEAICKSKDKWNDYLGSNFVEDYIEAYEYLRLGIDKYDVPTERIKSYVEKISKLFNTNEYSKPKITSLSRKLKYAISTVKHYKKRHVIDCETTIIDALIEYYINDDISLIEYGKYWKNILY